MGLASFYSIIVTRSALGGFQRNSSYRDATCVTIFEVNNPFSITSLFTVTHVCVTADRRSPWKTRFARPFCRASPAPAHRAWLGLAHQGARWRSHPPAHCSTMGLASFL